MDQSLIDHWRNATSLPDLPKSLDVVAAEQTIREWREQNRAYQRGLMRDKRNLRDALRSAIEAGDTELAVKLAERL